MWEKNGSQPLPIEFDIRDQMMFQPVGDNTIFFTKHGPEYFEEHGPEHLQYLEKFLEDDNVSIWPT